LGENVSFDLGSGYGMLLYNELTQLSRISSVLSLIGTEWDPTYAFALADAKKLFYTTLSRGVMLLQ